MAISGLLLVALAAIFAARFLRFPTGPGSDEKQVESPGDRRNAALTGKDSNPLAVAPGHEGVALAQGDARRAASKPAPVGGQPETPAVAAGSGRLPEDVRIQVEFFKDHSHSIDERRKQLERLAARGSNLDIQVLMALGDEATYLNQAAVDALGRLKAAGVADYLRRKLTDPDPRVLSAVVVSLARVEGAAAVPDIGKVIKDNRQRPDGFQDTVCAACVSALAETRSAAAVPVLDAELRETVGPILSYDYGSQVVAALLALGAPGGRSVLLGYAERLEQALARADANNPMGRRYMESKIKEAREAAGALAGPGPSTLPTRGER